jgi:hypothetical protein
VWKTDRLIKIPRRIELSSVALNKNPLLPHTYELIEDGNWTLPGDSAGQI